MLAVRCPHGVRYSGFTACTLQGRSERSWHRLNGSRISPYPISQKPKLGASQHQPLEQQLVLGLGTSHSCRSNPTWQFAAFKIISSQQSGTTSLQARAKG